MITLYNVRPGNGTACPLLQPRGLNGAVHLQDFHHTSQYSSTQPNEWTLDIRAANYKVAK